MKTAERAIRAQILHCRSSASADDPIPEYFHDGLLVISEGRVVECGPAEQLLKAYEPTLPVEDHPDKFLVPGFIDAHVHYPQLEMMAAYGTQLLDWLNRYTFPVEMKYTDQSYAQKQAGRFLDQLLRAGTTTALVFATSAVTSVDAFFEEAQRRNLRMLSGKVLMDRHAPAELCDTPERAYDESAELIERWSGTGRLGYAITPRFAPTSTQAQLQAAGQLHADYPDTYVHTHLSENPAEIDWVRSLFPERRDYLDVYEAEGLVGDRSVFAHGIHLSDSELERLGRAGASLCHCPSSNLFLGSGLFPLKKAMAQGIQVTLGSDVGGGTALSMLSTLGDAYKIQQLQSETLTPDLGFYLATLGAARALSLDQQIGNFEPGKEADCVLLDPKGTPALEARSACDADPMETLFALTILGDERVVSQVWVMGEPALPVA